MRSLQFEDDSSGPAKIAICEFNIRTVLAILKFEIQTGRTCDLILSFLVDCGGIGNVVVHHHLTVGIGAMRIGIGNNLELGYMAQVIRCRFGIQGQHQFWGPYSHRKLVGLYNFIVDFILPLKVDAGHHGFPGQQFVDCITVRNEPGPGEIVREVPVAVGEIVSGWFFQSTPMGFIDRFPGDRFVSSRTKHPAVRCRSCLLAAISEVDA